MDVRNIRLKIAYDGSNYAGWQTQPGLPTIQESIEIAIERMTGQRPRLIGIHRKWALPVRARYHAQRRALPPGRQAA